MFIPIGVLAVVAFFWFLTRSKKAEAEAERAFDVTVPTIFYDRMDEHSVQSKVDFRSFQLFTEYDDPFSHEVRIFDLRRSANGHWEARETLSSYEEWRQHLADGVLAETYVREYDESKPLEWKERGDWGEIERHYQAFVIEQSRGNRAPDGYDPLGRALAHRRRRTKRSSDTTP